MKIKEFAKTCTLTVQSASATIPILLQVDILGAPSQGQFMSDAPIPSVIAMLLCDQIINEDGTQKKSLIGIFQQVNSPNFPVGIPRMAVYARVADVTEDTEFKMRIVRIAGIQESLIVEAPLKVAIKDPTKPSELSFNLVNFVFEQPGKYEFQLHARDTYLHRVTLDVVKI